MKLRYDCIPKERKHVAAVPRFAAIAGLAGLTAGLALLHSDIAKADQSSSKQAKAACDSSQPVLSTGDNLAFAIGANPFGSLQVHEASQSSLEAEVVLPQIVQVSKDRGRVAALRLRMKDVKLLCDSSFPLYLKGLKQSAVDPWGAGSLQAFKNTNVNTVRDYSAHLSRHLGKHGNLGAIILYMASQGVDDPLLRLSYSAPYKFGAGSSLDFVFNSTVSGNSSIKFTVVSQDENSATIQVTTPGFSASLTIDKHLELDVYFGGQSQGFITMPYRMTSISVDADNHFDVRIAVDRAPISDAPKK